MSETETDWVKTPDDTCIRCRVNKVPWDDVETSEGTFVSLPRVYCESCCHDFDVLREARANNGGE